ncbi:MAG: helix-turn-helix transcriptional regulator [Chloroflexota bacterium]|nr:helix-turn-helix transcriptional regulator [Chloroflexota bacterium]
MKQLEAEESEGKGIRGVGGDGGGLEPQYPIVPILVKIQEVSSTEPPISSWVKQVRIQAGLTRKGLAETVGVHEKTVQSWEEGKTKPRQVKRQLLAKLMAEDPGTVFDSSQ